MVNNLESTQADWDDSDWKDIEQKTIWINPKKIRNGINLPHHLLLLLVLFYSDSTTPPSPLSNNDISNHFETLGIAITSCLKEVKFVYSLSIQINTILKNPSVKKKEVQNFNIYLMHTNPWSNLIPSFSSQGDFFKKLVTRLSYTATFMLLTSLI